MIKKIIPVIFLSFTGATPAQTDIITTQKDSGSTQFTIPVFSSNGGNTESDMDEQDVSALLQSSADVFTQLASFQFGAARYRLRGYAAENHQLLLNGVALNNLETGFSTWNSWSGLNDITRYADVQFGNTGSSYSFSGPGGYTYMDTRASSFTKGTRISYAAANINFKNRVMITHATGMLPNGWALTASASIRRANHGYIPGTYLNASSFFISADKRLNQKHALSFSGFFTPVEQGRASAEPLEAYQLAGTNYYNALWGYQQGRMRNSAVSSTKQPLLMLTHEYKRDNTSTLTSSVFYTFGKSGYTGLNWYNSPNPKPDYYRYLPSYYYAKGDVTNGDRITEAWRTDVNTRQIDWDQLIALNQGNLYTLPAQAGQGINTTETRARYIVEERIEHKDHIGLNSVYTKQYHRLSISTGVNAALYRNRKYKQVNDLLGATYWLDYDQFAQNLGVDPMLQQNNIDQPDKKIYKGDVFGYDYSIHIRQAEAWGQAEYRLKKLEVYGGLNVSGSSVWRESAMANGKFPVTSKGKSSKASFFNYGLKGGATYKISGRHFVTANGCAMTRAPEANSLFVSQTVRNDLVQGATSENILSGDLSYHVKYPALKLRLTYYNTQINNQLWLRRYWSDVYNTSINYFMTGVNENHQGLEFGLEKTLLSVHQLQGAFGYGKYVYTSRPLAQAWQDNNNTQLFTGRTVYLKNYRIGSSPQLAAGIGYKYTAPRYWFVGIYVNYFDQIYTETNPDRRTAEGIEKYTDDEMAHIHDIVAQERLPAFYSINLSAGKSFRIARNYQLRINLNVNNLTNNTTSITGGYEQLRWDQASPDKFANKYYFMTGTTYMVLVNLNF